MPNKQLHRLCPIFRTASSDWLHRRTKVKARASSGRSQWQELEVHHVSLKWMCLNMGYTGIALKDP